MLPSSLMLLNTAHEYLGRRSWCCNSDGALLRFYVSAALLARAGGGVQGRMGWHPEACLLGLALHWGLLPFFDFVCDYSELPESLNFVPLCTRGAGVLDLDLTCR